MYNFKKRVYPVMISAAILFLLFFSMPIFFVFGEYFFSIIDGNFQRFELFDVLRWLFYFAGWLSAFSLIIFLSYKQYKKDHRYKWVIIIPPVILLLLYFLHLIFYVN